MVGPGEGLVLGDMPMPTAWVPPVTARMSDALLVRWMHAEDEVSVVRYVDRLPDDIWEPDSLSFSVADEPLYLFDSAIPGQDLVESEYVAMSLPRGMYLIATSYFEPDERTALVLHRFRRSGT